MTDLPDVGAFGAAFSEFVEAMNAAAQGRESPLVARIREHLGTDPKELPTTSADFASTDHPNLQLALEAVLPDAERLGLFAMHAGFTIGLTELLSGHPMVGAVEPGAVQYTDVEVGDGRVVRCVSMGVFLAHHAGAAVALVLSSSERPFGAPMLRLEAISPDEGAVSTLLADVRAAMREHNVYRGQVISLHAGAREESVTVQFHRVPPIAREAVVLPDGIAERLERHAIGIAAQATRLKQAGRQLKRGVLLHGPPGTGKTLTINYLLGAMPGRTTVLLTGRNLGLAGPRGGDRLVRLYAGEVPLDDATEHDLVTRTNGLSGAFIRELMRQAALRAALEDRPASAADATAALTELLEERSTLTRRLLGQGGDQAGESPPPFPAMLHAFCASGISASSP